MMMQYCECLGLTRSQIEQLVRENGYSNARQVYKHASGIPCEVCYSEIQAIIRNIQALAES